MPRPDSTASKQGTGRIQFAFLGLLARQKLLNLTLYTFGSTVPEERVRRLPLRDERRYGGCAQSFLSPLLPIRPASHDHAGFPDL